MPSGIASVCSHLGRADGWGTAEFLLGAEVCVGVGRKEKRGNKNAGEESSTLEEKMGFVMEGSGKPSLRRWHLSREWPI